MKKEIIQRLGVEGGDKLPLDMHPVLRRVYAARNLSSGSDLDQSLRHLHPASLLSGIDTTVDLLQTALEEQWRVLIVADFDADGATSCALGIRALGAFGCRDVRYVVPNRFEFGYGLTPEIVTVCAEQVPDLIITVDNGISSIEGVDAAREQGIRVLVTDHHLPGDELPRADAIVNPNQPGDSFPSKNLAGVGVILYVLMALRTRLREADWFTRNGLAEPNIADFLDLVALGTVADVVPLDRNNRILVSQGIRRIRAGQCGEGIKALLNRSGRDRSRLVAADLGYAVAPRLNAAGRLDDMSLGIECLLSTDPARAEELAIRLDELNRERREIESRMQDQALLHLKECHPEGDPDLPFAVCLFQESWHPGVVGILASRIKDRLQRPVIAFARSGDDELKGSGRSIAGVHIRDVLAGVASSCPGLLTRFGGHAMAAGLTLSFSKLEEFRAAFNQQVGMQLNGELPSDVIYSDGELDAGDLGLDLAGQLRGAGPWGQGFPEPVFDGRFRIQQRRIVGERHLKLLLEPLNGGPVLDGIAFNQGVEPWLDPQSEVRVVYRLDVNDFRGRQSAQLVVEHMQPS